MKKSEQRQSKTFSRQMASKFFQGLLLLAPVALTLVIIFYIFRSVGSLLNLVGIEVGPVVDPVLGLLLVVFVITLVGVLSSTIVFRPLFSMMEDVMGHVPLVKILYSSLKDLFTAFVGDKKRFDKPALVTVDKGSGLQKLGFITKEDLSVFGLKDKVAVYLPHSYNFSGNMFIVSKDSVQPLEGVSSTEVMKFIVSGGVTEVEKEA